MNTRTLFTASLGTGCLMGTCTAAPVHGTASSGPHPPAGRQRPNILLIVMDDMGYSDLGCYGSEIKTQALDRLTAEGTRMTGFYANPRSCPTRASLMTGLYPTRAGIGHMDADFGVEGYRGFLNRNCATLGEALGAAGYETYMTGKWHLGKDEGQRPDNRGFAHTYALLAGGARYYNAGAMNEDGKPVRSSDPDFYMTNAIADKAVSYVTDAAKRNKPFMMYVAFNAVHTPLMAPKEDIDSYVGIYEKGWDEIRATRFAKQKALGLIAADTKLSPRHPDVPDWTSLTKKDRTSWTMKMAVYAAMLDIADRGIGRILDELERTGQLDNTVIMFLSDNGANFLGPKTVVPADSEWGDRNTTISYGLWANVSNTPLAYFKRWTHEGGVHVPFIVRGPGVVPGSFCGVLTHVIDIMPTCMDYAGASYPARVNDAATPTLDGVSIRAQFEGSKSQVHDYICWEHNGNRAVRSPRWKLVSQWGEDTDEKWELYDMTADPTECNDLVKTQKSMASQLESVYNSWVTRTGVLPWQVQLGYLGGADPEALTKGGFEASVKAAGTKVGTGQGGGQKKNNR